MFLNTTFNKEKYSSQISLANIVETCIQIYFVAKVKKNITTIFLQKKKKTIIQNINIWNYSENIKISFFLTSNYFENKLRIILIITRYFKDQMIRY